MPPLVARCPRLLGGIVIGAFSVTVIVPLDEPRRPVGTVRIAGLRFYAGTGVQGGRLPRAVRRAPGAPLAPPPRHRLQANRIPAVGVLAPNFSRWPFLAAVALIAAAASDILVEAIANAGMFGRAYFDTNDSSIVPSLIVAIVLAAGVIGGHVRAACRRSRARHDWLAAVAGDLAAQAPLRDVRYILGLQFAALFAMESVEQIVAVGHLAGGLLWLGGPPLISLALHLAVGLAFTLGAGWLMRVSVPHFASLVCCALEFALCARGPIGGGVLVVRRDAASCNHAQAIWAGRISGRAPPALPVFA